MAVNLQKGQKIDLTKGANNSGLQRTKRFEDWAIDSYRFLAKKFGEDNILSFYVHMDEKNPH
ncbi:MAG: plasmid recombination protein, partial [Oscillospiraceae bacterium]|nr:plasmid recombination protein [Oscillospiraceae bacterium]